MKNIKKNIIIYSFQSLEDPLLKGLMLEYLLRINKIRDDVVFHIITHEQKQYKLHAIDKKNKIKELEKANIKWYPVNYKTGKFLLLKKSYNFIQTFFVCTYIKLKFCPKAIIGFLPIAGGYSLMISKILRLTLVVFCFEPHSEYMIDFKIWNKKSLKYKLLNKFEKWQIKKATHITLPTNYSMQYAKKINPVNKKYLLPISVDTDLFNFSIENRNSIRNKFDIGNKTTLIYTGKFGGIYYNAEKIVYLFKRLLDVNPDYFLLIITPNVDDTKKEMKKNNISEKSFRVLNIVPYEQLSAYISAADIGLLAIPPLPSQKHRTPVKTGLYLSCGLPYIVNKGIAEDDLLAQKENIGIVIDDFENINYKKLSDNIMTFLSENKNELKKRCRKIALEQRNINLSVNILNQIINDIIL